MFSEMSQKLRDIICFYILIASEASFLVCSVARIFYIIYIYIYIIESVDSIIELVDSISRDERDVPLTQYITNA